MNPSKSIKDVQHLTRRVVALNQFISRSMECYLPFFKILKQSRDFKWIEECQQAFEELKSYLSSSSVLIKSKLEEKLYLYLIVFLVEISLVLVREKERTQRSIYYISKTLHDAETRYTRLKKLIYALIIVA